MIREGLLFGVIIGLFFLGIYKLEIESCKQKGVSFEGSRYGIVSGCMVNHQSKWLPLDNIRGFD